ncbi:RabGAP/TBC [Microthyrium microscopicum]|uniref:GTPase-activating protein GYP7 n=1 Tax=Microthyrium microscopicum TaxID=703497 RepID=A0A6A6U5M5_9PEZI|nr:RabGAP/TBC [Microthyrium microscopicum]
MEEIHSDPPSPTASFYALSDDEEGEYNTVRHTKSGKGVKLLFTKSKVYVHPTPAAKDNIPGFIALIHQKSEPGSIDERPTSSHSSDTIASNKLLLAWVPESSLGDSYDTYVKVDLSDTSSPPKTSFLVPAPPITTSASNTGLGAYAFSIPVCNIYSLLVRPPSIGWWFGSVVINTRAGDSFPALFFHDDECQSTMLQRKKLAREHFDPFHGGGMFWGGDEVLRWLKRYVKVERAGADPNIYLVEPTEDDRKGFGKMEFEKKKEQAAKEHSKNQDGAMDPFTKIIKETKWNILEKMSQITTFTRRTAQAVAQNQNLPPQLRNMMGNPTVQAVADEYDSARIYLARWAMQISEQSDRERNQRVWSAKDVLEMENTGVGDFEILEMEGDKSATERRKPVTLDEWNGFFDSQSGRLQITSDEVKSKVFHGGLDPEDGVRKEAWLFLLGVYEWDSSKEERQASTNSMRDEYIRLKGKWWERMVEGSSTPEQSEWWREQKNRIDRTIPLFAGEDIPHPDPDSPFADVGTNVHLEQLKDMLLTYNEYNTELGYVQGMSDLLAPIYAVMQDDAMAFWAFVKFMERMERNFLRDQSGMRLQLLTLDHLVQILDPQLYKHLQSADSTNFFFFFRMLLVWYKREFEWMDILRLWEVLWTDWLSSNFHIFIAVAILEKHRAVIMEHLQHFDEILKYINELSNTIDLEQTLVKAEALFLRFQRTVEAVDRKSSFPAPSSVRQRRQPSVADAQSPNQRATPALLPTPADQAAGATSGSDSVAAANSSAPTATDEAVDSTGKNKGKGRQTGDQQGTQLTTMDPMRTISPELRALLNREVMKLDKKDIQKHNGGMSK